MSVKEFLMTRWRWLVLVFLIVGPLLYLMGAGFYYLWINGWWFWVWWPLSACFALAMILAWRWQQRKQLLELDFTPAQHWTERDRQAWKLVEARAKEASKLPAEKLTSFSFYTETAQEMALEIARFYHPGARDPLGARTLPEFLAVMELASHDLAEMVDQYLPGGNLLTLNQWRQARQAADWYQTASNFTWMISSLFSPVNTAIRFLASQGGLVKPWQMLQQNLVLWFYEAFLHRLGTYLIDLNSGRLRVGAKRYRELMQGSSPLTPETQPAAREVTLVLFGQSKVGKSSLINALLGEQRAVTSAVPATSGITRYELTNPNFPNRLILLDTPGYSQAGPRVDQKKATLEAARNADLLLLVMHARNPARQADVEVLEHLRQFFADHAELKNPPILGVLTHIDLLSPSLEWQPPYNWQSPQRPKEQQIDQALNAARAQFGTSLAGMVPVCTAQDKIYGIQEWLLPALVGLLEEARAVALVRCLDAEADAGRVRKVFQQFLESGKAAAKILWTRLP